MLTFLYFLTYLLSVSSHWNEILSKNRYILLFDNPEVFPKKFFKFKFIYIVFIKENCKTDMAGKKTLQN